MSIKLRECVCEFCEQKFLRDPHDVGKHVYCSRSCSAKVNNKVPKRKKKQRYCTKCGAPTEGCKTLCNDHQQAWCTSNYTLSEAMSQMKASGPTNRYRVVRAHAREVAKKVAKEDGVEFACTVCGYTAFVDICHIQGISSFSDTSLVKEINDLSNMTLLCPNHHKEFDNGILPVKPYSLLDLLNKKRCGEGDSNP